MTAYKKAPAGTTVEAADQTILSVDGFGTVEVNLDQPGTMTKPMRMVSVGYVPGLSRNLLSTRKEVEQWGKPLVYYETKAVLGVLGKGVASFELPPPQATVFRNRCETDPELRGSVGVGSKNG